jgi:hypothetical protein
LARNRRVAWRRRTPRRAAGRLAWTTVVSVAVCATAWLLFGWEPADAGGGAVNPFALVVPMVFTLFGFWVGVQVLALVRRPIVSANHYALTVRPGVVRTLVLPWAQIAELAMVEVDEEPFLLVQCAPQRYRSGDWPRWWDKTYLRSAKRAAAAVAAYDLAVPMSDFAGTPMKLLAELALWAPEHVTIADRGGRH